MPGDYSRLEIIGRVTEGNGWNEDSEGTGVEIMDSVADIVDCYAEMKGRPADAVGDHAETDGYHSNRQIWGKKRDF